MFTRNSFFRVSCVASGRIMEEEALGSGAPRPPASAFFGLPAAGRLFRSLAQASCAALSLLNSSSHPPALSGCTLRATERNAERTCCSEESLLTFTGHPKARPSVSRSLTNSRLETSNRDGILTNGLNRDGYGL